MSNFGWIRLDRKIISNWVWEEKPFSYGQAWVDMLLMANHTSNRFPLGDEIIALEKGDFITSELKLMERWGWSKSKVRRFLKLLEIDGMILKKTDRRKTMIKIVKYDTYQDLKTNERPIRDLSQTDSRPIKDTNNNDNNENNVTNRKQKEREKERENKEKPINYQLIADMYNDTCVSFPRLTRLSDTRKKAINARMKQYNIEDFKKLFQMAEASSFLKGQNARNWSANFDWLIKDANMAKVLDGNYANKKQDTNESEQEKMKSQCRDYDEEMKKMLGDDYIPLDGPFF